eukprot:4454791-Heterocapsa_arctica.AAC.1
MRPHLPRSPTSSRRLHPQALLLPLQAVTRARPQRALRRSRRQGTAAAWVITMTAPHGSRTSIAARGHPC